MSSKAIWKIQMTASKNALSFMIFLMTTGCTNVFASQNKQEKIDRDAIYLKILDRKSDELIEVCQASWYKPYRYSSFDEGWRRAKSNSKV